jgi:hypothetical protein
MKLPLMVAVLSANAASASGAASLQRTENTDKTKVQTPEDKETLQASCMGTYPQQLRTLNTSKPAGLPQHGVGCSCSAYDE